MFRELNEQLEKFIEEQVCRYDNNVPKGWKVLLNKTYINDLKISNPARSYIILSPEALQYLQKLNYPGIITSGAEGCHAKGLNSHYNGYKVDLQTIKGKEFNLEEYTNLAIVCMNNPLTDMINFEGFSKEQYKAILTKIKEKLSEDEFNNYKGSFLNTYSPNHHLDIRIKRNSL